MMFGFILSSVYSVAGISAFAVFCVLNFYPAAVFGFITAATSIVTTHLIYLFVNKKLETWYRKEDLRQLFIMGFWTLSLSAAGFVYFLTTVFFTRVVTTSNMINIVWTLISLKSGGVLMYFAERFAKLQPPLIVNEVQPAP